MESLKDLIKEKFSTKIVHNRTSAAKLTVFIFQQLQILFWFFKVTFTCSEWLPGWSKALSGKGIIQSSGGN